MYVAALSILWIGGRMILAGKLGVGSLTGFMSYVLLIMNSLMMISNVFLLLTRALTSVGRIAEVLDEEPLSPTPRETSRLRHQRTAVSSFATFPLNTARMQTRMCSSISTFASRAA